MSQDQNATEFTELKTLVASKTRDELLAYANEQEGGPAAVLDRVFDNMPRAFRPEKARGQSVAFQYVIDTPDGAKEYFVRLHDGTCETGRGTVDSPKLTMKVALPEFLRLITGQLNGTQAFLTGKIKLSGDIFYAAKFENWFERP